MNKNPTIETLLALIALLMYSSPFCFSDQKVLNPTTYAEKGYLTYDVKPMGSKIRPLIMRTFAPSLEINREFVLPNHSRGTESPKYSPSSGKESTNFYEPIDGVPATIAVNLGQTLSYVWDTTECRLLYAWTDGFLDMKNYWGNRESGRRRGFGYVPRLYGFVFYKAQGIHPLHLDGNSISKREAPRYKGYSLGPDRLPTFDYEVGKSRISVKVEPGPSVQTLSILFSTSDNEKMKFQSPNTQVQVIEETAKSLHIVIRPNAGERFSSEVKKEVILKPTIEIGESLYTSLGCIACHSLDGGKNHGPTLKGSYGAKREFLESPFTLVDDAYIRESIEKPTAKTVKGYLKGMMPPYKLQPAEYDSLILFIKSVR